MSAFSDMVDQGDLEDHVRAMSRRKMVEELMSPQSLAGWFATRTLRELNKLRIELAKEGVILDVECAEIELQPTEPRSY